MIALARTADPDGCHRLACLVLAICSRDTAGTDGPAGKTDARHRRSGPVCLPGLTQHTDRHDVVAAMFLSGSLDAGMGVLGQVRERRHPAVVRLYRNQELETGPGILPAAGPPAEHVPEQVSPAGLPAGRSAVDDPQYRCAPLYVVLWRSVHNLKTSYCALGT